jgi:UDP-N-acetylglucosamine 1-carboxyvinyltransferase
LSIESVDVSRCRADERWVSRMRASFCVLGPLLARSGKAVVALPGGCNLGTRPVDLHLRALERLGADISVVHGYVIATANRLRGNHVSMRGPYGTTVTGTANILCAAVRAEGVTHISGAAREPEIQDLGRFLQSLGAEIHGLGTEEILVRGQPGLGGATHQIIPDRIEAGTFLLAAVAAGGTVRVEGVNTVDLQEVLAVLEQLGALLQVLPRCVTLKMEDRPQPLDVVATPYPGFPTDLQAPLMAALLLAEGRSRITDAVFPLRFMHIGELNRLAAKIEHNLATATVTGVRQLSGANVLASDLRAAAALAIAGLAARGITNVAGLHHLDRGYAQFEQKLGLLGADVCRSCDAAQSTAVQAA